MQQAEAEQLKLEPAGSAFVRVLDLIERLVVLVLTALFLHRLIPHMSEGPYVLLIMVSESLGALFMLIRRPGAMATTPYAWLIAMIGTWTPLLIVPGGEQLAPMSLALGLMVAGLLSSISAKIFLRRSFGIVPANRGVQREGPYRAVRHPIYLGYLLCQLGFLSISFSGWNLLVYTVCWLATLLRIAAEETILSEDEDYRRYRVRVRYRILPAIW
jgi:protein-S-isoprenylcysteine O-methyltransferase Ste14